MKNKTHMFNIDDHLKQVSQYPYQQTNRHNEEHDESHECIENYFVTNNHTYYRIQISGFWFEYFIGLALCMMAFWLTIALKPPEW